MWLSFTSVRKLIILKKNPLRKYSFYVHVSFTKECPFPYRKCLEQLSLQCGHRRLPRKVAIFGVDLSNHLLGIYGSTFLKNLSKAGLNHIFFHEIDFTEKIIPMFY